MPLAPVDEAVLRFVGAPLTEDMQDRALQAVEIAYASVRSYVRDVGCRDSSGEVITDPYSCYLIDGPLYAVVIACAARALNNPTHDRRIETGSYSAVPGMFSGFTLGDLAVLNRYRRRVA